MKIAIIGASGSIGTVLVQHLLNTTTHQLILFSHHAEDLHYSEAHERRLTHINGTVLKKTDITNALKNCDAAVYLVHLMGDIKRKGQFMDADAEAATNFAEAAALHNIQKIVYVGGMGQPDQEQTQHLASREQTGKIIRKHVQQLIEFKVPLVVGPRAAGFETLRSLVEHLPLLPIPAWANAEAQPIVVDDVARFITAAIELPTGKHITLEIGGPEVMTYQVLAERYAVYKNKRLRVVRLPYIPKRLALAAIRLIVPRATSATVTDMIDSAAIPMTTDMSRAQQLFPNIKTKPVEAGFKAFLK